jgi:hypothetical protein
MKKKGVVKMDITLNTKVPISKIVDAIIRQDQLCGDVGDSNDGQEKRGSFTVYDGTGEELDSFYTCGEAIAFAQGFMGDPYDDSFKGKTQRILLELDPTTVAYSTVAYSTENKKLSKIMEMGEKLRKSRLPLAT